MGLVLGKQKKTLRELEIQSRCKITIMHPYRLRIEGETPSVALDLISSILKGKRLRESFEGVAPTKGRIYMDVLNFASSHFFVDSDDWTIAPVMKRVEEFCNACKKANIELRIFIDVVREEKALKKWYTRMTRNVKEGNRGVPQHISGFLGQMFHKAGVLVCYATEVNNDDTLASYAYHDDAAILSEDQDYMFYYRPEDFNEAIKRPKPMTRPIAFQQYTDFKLNSETLELQMKMKDPNVSGSFQCDPCVVQLDPLPKYTTPEQPDISWVGLVKNNREYRGGAPSPLVRKLGFNPYITIRSLRQGLYHFIFKDHRREGDQVQVREEFPVWIATTQTVDFESITVNVPAVLERDTMELLQDPKRAFQHFFPRECEEGNPPEEVNEQDWYRHVHGCKVIVVEICTTSWRLDGTDGPKPTFLDTMIESETWFTV